VKQKDLYIQFEELSIKLGMKIVKGKGDFIGGRCTVNNQKVIVINKLKPMEHRLKILALTFLEYNLDSVYVVPYLRAFIEDFRSLDL
jgi:hypothetical protein